MPDGNNTQERRPGTQLDVARLSGSMQAGTTGNPMQYIPQDFGGLLEMAKLVSMSGKAVPAHLRGNPGGCLFVAQVAYSNGFNPWMLANASYEVNDRIAFEAKAIAAMVNNSPALKGRLHYDLEGEWPSRLCTVRGRIAGDDRDKTITIDAATITTRNSPLWKQQPDIQLQYYAARAWARIHMPEVIMGLVSPDEAATSYGGDLEVAADGTYRVQAAPARPTRSAAAGTGANSAWPADPVDTGGDDGKTAKQPDGKTESRQPDQTFALVDESGEVVFEDKSPVAVMREFRAMVRRVKTQGGATSLYDANETTFRDMDGLVDFDPLEEAQAIVDHRISDLRAENKARRAKAQAEDTAEQADPAEPDMLGDGDDDAAEDTMPELPPLPDSGNPVEWQPVAKALADAFNGFAEAGNAAGAVQFEKAASEYIDGVRQFIPRWGENLDRVIAEAKKET